MTLRVKDKGGKILAEGKMDKTSKYSFKKPGRPYSCVFDAGEGHVIEIDGKTIVEIGPPAGVRDLNLATRRLPCAVFPLSRLPCWPP